MKRLEIPEADLPTDLYEDDVFKKEKNEFGKPIKNIYANIYEENVSIMRFPLLYCRSGPESFNRIPFKNRFFRSRYPYSQSGALAIYDCMRVALRKGYLVQKKRFLKGALKGVLEGYLIK